MNKWIKNMIIAAVCSISVGFVLKLVGFPVSDELGITVLFGLWITLNQLDNDERKNKVKKASKNQETPRKR